MGNNPSEDHGRPEYPAELSQAESDAIQARRIVAAVGAHETRVGLALSGGGIRSATFALGLVQGLSGTGALKRIDIMSTVSGGTYLGTFLGALFLPRDVTRAPSRCSQDEVAAQLRSDSTAVSWLRENGRYLAPNGAGDLLVTIAGAIRSWATIQAFLAVAGFLLFSAMIGAESSVRTAVAWWSSWFHWRGPDGSPYWALARNVAGLIPAVWLAFWLVGDERHARQDTAFRVVVVVVTAVALWFGWRGLSAVLMLSLAAGVLLSIDSGQDFTSRLSREKGVRRCNAGLARLMLASVVLMIVALAYSFKDDGLQFQVVFSIVIAVFGLGWFVALLVRVRSTGRVQRAAEAALAGIPAIVWAISLLFVVARLAHQAMALAPSLEKKVAYALLVLVMVTAGRSLQFLNRTTHHPMYRARVSRAYLGASNRYRMTHGGTTLAITNPIQGDDIDMYDYRPDRNGGPLHLIGMTLNETRSGRSQIEQRDRKGLSFVVSSLGVSVAREFHGLWGMPRPPHASASANSPIAALKGVANTLQSFINQGKAELESRSRPLRRVGASTPYHALFGRDQYVRDVECLSVGGWAAISGAAVSTGLGASTTLATSVLCALANVRLGYWWNSHLPFREIAKRAGWFRVVGERLQPVYTHLTREMAASFHGPNRSNWYLTDGGHFENTGAFELVRRRVPLIIASDAGMDPSYAFVDVANLIRKARLDLKADIRVLTEKELDFVLLAYPDLRPLFGTLEHFRTTGVSGLGGRHAQAHAMLAWVFYDGAGDGEPTLAQAQKAAGSLLLVVKPSLTGDERIDVLNYREEHPAFPHEPTSDQFFNESQWESYRFVGEHIARQIFRHGLKPYEL